MILALLARPVEETNHGMYELLCEAARGKAYARLAGTVAGSSTAPPPSTWTPRR